MHPTTIGWFIGAFLCVCITGTLCTLLGWCNEDRKLFPRIWQAEFWADDTPPVDDNPQAQTVQASLIEGPLIPPLDVVMEEVYAAPTTILLPYDTYVPPSTTG